MASTVRQKTSLSGKITASDDERLKKKRLILVKQLRAELQVEGKPKSKQSDLKMKEMEKKITFIRQECKILKKD